MVAVFGLKEHVITLLLNGDCFITLPSTSRSLPFIGLRDWFCESDFFCLGRCLVVIDRIVSGETVLIVQQANIFEILS